MNARLCGPRLLGLVLAALAGVAACDGDAPVDAADTAVSFPDVTFSEVTGSDTTSAETASPDTTDADAVDEDTGPGVDADADEPDTTAAADTSPAGFCGDGEVQDGEECDDGAANSDTAPDACRTDCTEARCGDGVADTGEVCDGADVRGTTCVALDAGAFSAGVPACATDCSALDTSPCVPIGAVCGDGVRDPGEECDGFDFGGATCANLGLGVGALSCAAGCVLDTSGCACTEDGLAPNHSTSQAAPLEPGLSEGLWICSGSDDYHSLTVCPGGTLYVAVHFTHAHGDLDAQLLDGSGGVLLTAASQSDDEHLLWVNSSDVAVPVFVRVYAPAGVSNAYSLLVTISDCAVFVCEPDPFAGNDTAGTAAAIGPGVYPGLTICEDELDYFALTVCPGGTLDAEIAFAHAVGDLDLYLYSVEGAELDWSESVTDDERIVWTNSAGIPAAVYLIVAGYEGATNGYDLTVAITDCALVNHETFDNRPTLSSNNYDDFTFPGVVPGTTWSVVHGRDEVNSGVDYGIDGAGVLLRRAQSSASVDLPGVSSVTVEVRKAFTSAEQRRVELVAVTAAGETLLDSLVWSETSGADATVRLLEARDIHIAEPVMLLIRIPGSDTTNRHVTIDNVRWSP